VTDTHVNEPIDKTKELSGTSRKGGDAPPEIQQKIVDIIIEEARKRKFNNRDIAYYLAIAKRESGLNPDAASDQSTASGIAQVIDKTAKNYGITDSNRFDARSSIKAGLGYFMAIKDRIAKDYGSSSGLHEPLIYLLYHYGEFIHYNDRKRARDPKPLRELMESTRYSDSKTVVDEAERIETILNGSHALKVQLTDVLGKPMTGRKAIVVRKKPIAAPSGASAPLVAQDPANDLATATAPATDAAVGQEATIASDARSDKKAVESAAPPSSCEAMPEFPEEWDLIAYEVTTDDNGNLPNIESEIQEPFVILIPRIEYEAYNDAVSKQIICEYGNDHEIQTRDGEQGVLPMIKPPDTKIENKEAEKIPVSSTQLQKPDAPSTKEPLTDLDSAGEEKEKAPLSSNPEQEITLDDVLAAVQKDLGWKNVYSTSFAYIKQFFTRPKLPATMLHQSTNIAESSARTQVIGSSLQNKDTKTAKVEDKVTTALQTAVKEVKVAEDAPWMTHAIQEQSKSGTEAVEENRKSHRNDARWKEKYKIRNGAEKAIKSAQEELKKELSKPEKSRDAKKTSELQQKIKEQEAIRDQADQDMQEIEKEHNNQDIVKYLQSTSLARENRDAARDDATAWCSSFANWCVEKSGYHGTGSASADSWLNWGEKIDQPKYGAITITTRASDPVKYHVGFFLGIGHKDIPDGEEEVEVKEKNGQITKQKRKKKKKVETVRLLSGNYSRKILEGDEWMVHAEDNPVKHLVSYRWPTSKEKKK
jgi:uncharacterized protein (TIGR02594 family)